MLCVSDESWSRELPITVFQCTLSGFSGWLLRREYSLNVRASFFSCTTHRVRPRSRPSSLICSLARSPFSGAPCATGRQWTSAQRASSRGRVRTPPDRETQQCRGSSGRATLPRMQRVVRVGGHAAVATTTTVHGPGRTSGPAPSAPSTTQPLLRSARCATRGTFRLLGSPCLCCVHMLRGITTVLHSRAFSLAASA